MRFAHPSSFTKLFGCGIASKYTDTMRTLLTIKPVPSFEFTAVKKIPTTSNENVAFWDTMATAEILTARPSRELTREIVEMLRDDLIIPGKLWLNCTGLSNRLLSRS